jgi:hypothetical protein
MTDKAKDLDQVRKLDNVPTIYPGAPKPRVFATEHSIAISYWLEFPTDAEMLAAKSPLRDMAGRAIYAVIVFRRCTSHLFGYPNSEAFMGHLLAEHGYIPFSAYEVCNSSWIKQIEKMNRVHSKHSPSLFLNRRHFIFGFHDTTFEVICHDYEVHFVSDDPSRTRCLSEMIRLASSI